MNWSTLQHVYKCDELQHRVYQEYIKILWFKSGEIWWYSRYSSTFGRYGIKSDHNNKGQYDTVSDTIFLCKCH